VIHRCCDYTGDCFALAIIYWLKSSSEEHACHYVLLKVIATGTLALKSLVMGMPTFLCCLSVLVTGMLANVCLKF